MPKNTLTPEEIIKAHYQEIGRKGGQTKTPKKARASRKNGAWNKYKTPKQRREARAATQLRYQQKKAAERKALKDAAEPKAPTKAELRSQKRAREVAEAEKLLGIK